MLPWHLGYREPRVRCADGCGRPVEELFARCTVCKAQYQARHAHNGPANETTSEGLTP